MNEPTYLKPWLANCGLGIRIMVFLVLLSSISQLGTFSLSQNYMIAYLGAQPEDITFAILIAFVGFLVNLPLAFRFLRYFEIRSYLTVNLILQIVLSIACWRTTDIDLFFIFRFLQGICICSVCVSMLVVILSVLTVDVRQVIGPTVFYGTVLSSTVLIGLVAANVSQSTDIRNLYVWHILFQVCILGLVLLTFNSRSNIRRYPLYQIDWPGCIFFVSAAGCLAYTLIYGSRNYWFEDQRIRISATIAISGALLFLWRQSVIKRPLANLRVFRNRNFVTGLFLLAMYYGMKESINLIYGYTAAVLQWSQPRIIQLGLCNITGLVISMAITGQLLVRYRQATLQFMIAGLSVLMFYHWWMYRLFTPDLSFNNLVFPMFLQGVASGMLFVPISFFLITSVPPEMGTTPLFIAANTRVISLLNASAGFYNLQLYYNQLYKESFLNHLTAVDQQTSEQLDRLGKFFVGKGFSPDQAAHMANNSLYRTMEIHSQLLTDRAIFFLLAVFISIVVILALLGYLYRLLYVAKYQ
jgi:DHA2 family multidrug resistance protein